MRMKPSKRDVGREEEDEALLDVVDDPPTLRQAVHQRRERVVTEDEVGGLLGDRGAAAHRDRDIGAVERRCVIDAVARDRDEPTRRRAASTSRTLLVGRGPRHDRAESPAARAPAARRPTRASSVAGARSAGRRGPPARRWPPPSRGWSPVTTTTWIPAPRAVAMRLADPRAGSGPRSRASARMRPRPVVDPAGERRRRRSPAAARLLDDGSCHASGRQRSRRPASMGSTASGAPSASSSTRPSRRLRVPSTAGHPSDGSRSTRSPGSRARVAAGRLDGASRSARVNEPGGRPALAQPRRRLRREAPPRSTREPARRARSTGAVRCRDGGDDQPVLRSASGLVGDDQVDRAERLLGVEPTDEHAAAQQPVGAEAEDRPRAGPAAPRGWRRSRPRCPPAGSRRAGSRAAKPSPMVIAMSPTATTSRMRTSRSSSRCSGERRRSARRQARPRSGRTRSPGRWPRRRPSPRPPTTLVPEYAIECGGRAGAPR